MARWDSAMTTIPLMPKGLNSWKATSTMVAFASSAAFFSVSCTNSRLPRVLGLQSFNSNNRWVPQCVQPVYLLLRLLHKLRDVSRSPQSTASRSLRRVKVRCQSVSTSRRRQKNQNLVVIYQILNSLSRIKVIRTHFFLPTLPVSLAETRLADDVSGLIFCCAIYSFFRQMQVKIDSQEKKLYIRPR